MSFCPDKTNLDPSEELRRSSDAVVSSVLGAEKGNAEMENGVSLDGTNQKMVDHKEEEEPAKKICKLQESGPKIVQQPRPKLMVNDQQTGNAQGETSTSTKSEGNANANEDEEKIQIKRKNSIAHYLISKGARCDQTDKYGISPLHSSAKNGNVEISKLLVQNGAKVDQQESICGFTPLHIAVHEGQMALVKFFVEECRADIEIVDSKGNTAWMIAKQNGKADIVDFLGSKGARTDRTTDDANVSDRSPH